MTRTPGRETTQAGGSRASGHGGMELPEREGAGVLLRGAARAGER